jgi:flagellar biogenesis protein FliO
MLIDVLGNIMVIGVSSSKISLLTEIVDSESLEQLKDIQGQEGKSVPFSGYLKGLLKSSSQVVD